MILIIDRNQRNSVGIDYDFMNDLIRKSGKEQNYVVGCISAPRLRHRGQRRPDRQRQRLLFEETRWIVRWLVVDTCNWLSSRKVLLPVSALGTPDPALRQFPIKLSMQQVEDSPDIDADRPVSRQHETHVYEYYGWNPYWDNGLLPIGSGMAMPVIETLPRPESMPLGTAGEDTQHVQGDPHLRSAQAATGFHVHATDGEIGQVVDFLVDDAAWSIRYIKVNTDKWWPGISVLMPPRSVSNIDRRNRLVHLDVNRQEVLNSPPYDPSQTVDGAYDETFLTYYGIRWVEA